MSQDGLFFPIFKTVKKQNPHSRSEKTGDEKGASALVSVFKLAKSGFLCGGGSVLLLPVIRVDTPPLRIRSGGHLLAAIF